MKITACLEFVGNGGISFGLFLGSDGEFVFRESDDLQKPSPMPDEV